MNYKLLCLSMTALLLLANTAEAKRILFYEVGTSADYTIESGYSKLNEELKNKGYEIASITRGEISKESLVNYDILIIMNLGKTLSTEEISVIMEFVLQKGRAVYINGAGTNVNQISIPFGMTVDTGTLIDTTDQIPGLNDRTTFTVDRFNEHPAMSTLRQGVTKIGFYKGSGLKISTNARAIAEGDSDTYSDTGSFPAGSYPPISAAVIFGNGLVFMTSDADFLNNKNIEDYNNKRFGLNIIDWLSISMEPGQIGNTTQELQYIIAEQKLTIARLQLQVNQTTEEKNSLIQQNSMLNSQLVESQSELLELQAGLIGPFSRTNWAIIILGVCIMIGTFIISKRKQAPATPIKDEEILNELGYEIDGEDEKTADQSDGAGADLDSELDNIKL